MSAAVRSTGSSPQNSCAISLSSGVNWKVVRYRCKTHTEHSERSVGDSRLPHITQLRGAMKSTILVHQYVISRFSFIPLHSPQYIGG